jgi:hypothetical protein
MSTYQWKSEETVITALSLRLQKLEEDGWEIFEVSALGASHALVISRKPLQTVARKKPGKQAYSAASAQSEGDAT